MLSQDYVFLCSKYKNVFFSGDHEFCEACTVVATPFINCRQAAIMNGDCDSSMDEDDLEECIEDECYDELTAYHACEYSSPDCGKCPRHVLFFFSFFSKTKIFHRFLKIFEDLVKIQKYRFVLNYFCLRSGRVL